MNARQRRKTSRAQAREVQQVMRQAIAGYARPLRYTLEDMREFELFCRRALDDWRSRNPRIAVLWAH